MIKQLLITCSVFMSVLSCMAQSIEYSNVYRFRPRNSGAIMENNTIAGYYNFQTLKKKTKRIMAIKSIFMIII